MPRAPFESFALSFYLFFFGRKPIFLNDQKISQFGHSVRKGRLVNTVSASFNTITRRMTDKSERQIQVFALFF